MVCELMANLHNFAFAGTTTRKTMSISITVPDQTNVAGGTYTYILTNKCLQW